MNKYAIFFVIDDGYSFALANMIMSLYKHSNNLMQQTDIIIYDNGISERNKQLLKQLHQHIFFKTIEYPESYSELISHKKTTPWGGGIIVCKLWGFRLIKEYEKVLFLDADMHIIDDISELFEIEEEMAWRNVLAWKATDNFQGIINDGDYLSAGNAGLTYYSNKLNKYNITDDDIVDAFNKVKDLKRGGNDETMLAYIAYKNKIRVRELDVKIWNTPIQRMSPDTKILHFLDYFKISTKPWKNLASYYYFDDWASNYKKWLEMGGNGLVDLSKEKHWELFSFDKLKQIDKLNKKSHNCSDIIEENKKLKAELNKIKNSRSYKITAPLRWLSKKIRKIKKIFKK